MSQLLPSPSCSCLAVFFTNHEADVNPNSLIGYRLLASCAGVRCHSPRSVLHSLLTCLITVQAGMIQLVLAALVAAAAAIDLLSYLDRLASLTGMLCYLASGLPCLQAC